jgi:hypothetical protein
MSFMLSRAGALIAAAVVAACGGGGGGAGAGSNPEAVVQSVTVPMMLETNASQTMVFTVTLDKPAALGVTVVFSTASTAKPGGGVTGTAVGGSSCAAGVDYIERSGATVLIRNDQRTGEIPITICGDTVPEPLETFRLNWSAPGQSGSVVATIVNDDAGGLASGGVGTAPISRDVLALTNGGADGRVGLSYASVAGTGGVNCTRDNVTGLLWEGKTPANGATTFTFAQAQAYVATVNGLNGGAGLCGFNNWRLPTTEELASLVDAGIATAPTLDAAWLPNSLGGRYWSGTTYGNGIDTDAWFVDFANGAIGREAKTQAYLARLVSPGGNPARPAAAACTDTSRFTDHGDGTVSDSLSGLMWKKCPEGLTGGGCGTGVASALSWDAAVARVTAVNADASGAGLGYADWRLPTRVELSSLTQREACAVNIATPSIVSASFPNTGIFDYWSATTDAFAANRAWYVNFSDGEVSPTLKVGSAAKRVRLVRAGQ